VIDRSVARPLPMPIAPRLTRRPRIAALAALGGLAMLAACTSPEASRTRGGGPGADIRNVDARIQMHAGSRMYHQTPCLIPDERCTGPLPSSGLPGDFPAPTRERR
jgi:hypothetical protein